MERAATASGGEAGPDGGHAGDIQRVLA